MGTERKNIFFITLSFLLISVSCDLRSQTPALYEMQENTRSEVNWEFNKLSPRASLSLCNLNGEGIINRFWCTFLPTTEKENNYLGRALVINIYWDGSETPAVSAPLADFFCQPIKLQAIDNHFFNSSNEFCVFNSLIPMPFRKEARIEIINDTDKEILFWFGADVEYKKLDQNSLYLHTYWHRLNDVPAATDFTLLPHVRGKGRYLGTHIALNQQKVQDEWPWYTRPVSIYLDQKDENDKPTLRIGTLDDFVCSGWWGMEKERRPYASGFTGRSLVQTDTTSNLSVVMYRYHVQDPLWFKEGISFKIGPSNGQNIAKGDWSTTSFFYLDKPANSLPAIQDVNIRTKGFK